MSSSKFCRRPRVQPLPPVCKGAPETTSCYDRPTEPPEPLHVSGSLEITNLAGARLYYSTFRAHRNRSEDYRWNLQTTDSNGNPCEPDVEWNRPAKTGDFNVTFAIPIWGGQTFSWSPVKLTDAFPWLFNLKQTKVISEIHICNATFWN